MHPDQEAVRIRKENNDRASPPGQGQKSMTHLISLFPFVETVFHIRIIVQRVMPIDGDIDFLLLPARIGFGFAVPCLYYLRKIFI